MGKSISLKRGYDIKLLGEALKEISEVPVAEIFAVKPTDYFAIVPKLLVKVGDEVLEGGALFQDKQRPEINFPSPVSGEVVEIVRGAKRKVLEIRILADKVSKHTTVNIPSELTVENVKETLLNANLWSLLRQRPFSIIPDVQDLPKAIFISTFDTAPLAPDLSFIVAQNKTGFDAGLKVLEVLSNGNLEVGVTPASDLSILSGNKNEFSGPHPSGNVGIQIHHTNPIRVGEKVWYMDVQDVIVLGQLFLTGMYDPTRILAFTGSEVDTPSYYKLKVGQSLSKLFSDHISNDNVRYIQGNVLTGETSHKEDYLSFYTSQLTVIPEGNKAEFLGWLLPSAKKLSLSRTYFSWLMPSKKYEIDTNTHGEERAFVMSGEYEKVLPMNIMPVQLLKAIMVGDIEKMEALGIYEVSEEDLALCEFVCTSKIDVQQLVRRGLDLMRAEG